MTAISPSTAAIPNATVTAGPAAMPQGMAPQGMVPQGYAPQGMIPQGYAPQGMVPQGYGPQGIVPQGYGPQGMAAQGSLGYGAMPQGNGVRPIVVSSPGELPAGAMPISQAMMAQAMGQGQLGAAAVQPPSTAKTVLASAMKGVATGGAAGFAFGLLPLPGGKLISAAIGAAAGGALGLVRGISTSKRHQAEYASMQQLMTMQQPGSQTVGMTADPNAPTTSPANPTSRAAQKRRMDARRAEIRAELAAKKQD